MKTGLKCLASAIMVVALSMGWAGCGQVGDEPQFQDRDVTEMDLDTQEQEIIVPAACVVLHWLILDSQVSCSGDPNGHYKHCFLSCMSAKDCGIWGLPLTVLVGILKEVFDELFGNGWDPNDIDADVNGLKCATKFCWPWENWSKCNSCCRSYGYRCEAYCGDGACNGGETCSTCSQDCGQCQCKGDYATCYGNSECCSGRCACLGVMGNTSGYCCPTGKVCKFC